MGATGLSAPVADRGHAWGGAGSELEVRSAVAADGGSEGAGGSTTGPGVGPPVEGGSVGSADSADSADSMGSPVGAGLGSGGVSTGGCAAAPTGGCAAASTGGCAAGSAGDADPGPTAPGCVAGLSGPAAGPGMTTTT